MVTVVNTQGCGASTFSVTGTEITWFEKAKEVAGDVKDKAEEIKGGIEEVLDEKFVPEDMAKEIRENIMRGGGALGAAAGAALKSLPNSLSEVGRLFSDGNSVGDALKNIGEDAFNAGAGSLADSGAKGLEEVIKDTTGQDVDVEAGAGTTGGKMYAQMRFDWELGNWVLIEEGCTKLQTFGNFYGALGWQEGDGFDASLGAEGGVELLHDRSGVSLRAGYRADSFNDFEPQGTVGFNINAGKLWDFVSGGDEPKRTKPRY